MFPPAKRVLDALTITGQYTIEGQLVVETTCVDYDAYKALPQVISYEGVECGLTGWSSDSGRACYKQGALIARKIR